MEAVIQLAVDEVQDFHSAAKNVIIHPDNTSGFALQELTMVVFNMNTRLDDEKMLFWEDG